MRALGLVFEDKKKKKEASRRDLSKMSLKCRAGNKLCPGIHRLLFLSGGARAEYAGFETGKNLHFARVKAWRESANFRSPLRSEKNRGNMGRSVPKGCNQTF